MKERPSTFPCTGCPGGAYPRVSLTLRGVMNFRSVLDAWGPGFAASQCTGGKGCSQSKAPLRGGPALKLEASAQHCDSFAWVERLEARQKARGGAGQLCIRSPSIPCTGLRTRSHAHSVPSCHTRASYLRALSTCRFLIPFGTSSRLIKNQYNN